MSEINYNAIAKILKEVSTAWGIPLMLEDYVINELHSYYILEIIIYFGAFMTKIDVHLLKDYASNHKLVVATIKSTVEHFCEDHNDAFLFKRIPIVEVKW